MQSFVDQWSETCAFVAVFALLLVFRGLKHVHMSLFRLVHPWEAPLRWLLWSTRRRTAWLGEAVTAPSLVVSSGMQSVCAASMFPDRAKS